jgi:TadE-like protein
VGIFVLTVKIAGLSVIEGGWFFYVQLTLTNAAREGAKMAVRPLSGADTLMTVTEIKNTSKLSRVYHDLSSNHRKRTNPHPGSRADHIFAANVGLVQQSRISDQRPGCYA